MAVNLCRCGTHMRILAAVRRAAAAMGAADRPGRRAMTRPFSRRDLLAMGGGLIVSFSLVAALPPPMRMRRFRAACRRRRCSMPGSAWRPTAGSRCSPARPNWARASRPPCCRSPPSSSTSRRGHCPGHRRHRDDAERRLHRRQPFHAGQRHRDPERRSAGPRCCCSGAAAADTRRGGRGDRRRRTARCERRMGAASATVRWPRSWRCMCVRNRPAA